MTACAGSLELDNGTLLPCALGVHTGPHRSTVERTPFTVWWAR